MHSDPFASLFLQLASTIALGLGGRSLAKGLNQPAVLGEIAMGVAAVNLSKLLGWSFAPHIQQLDVFANLGLLLLLLNVGLETEVSQLLKVGPRALVVALVGVIAPMSLGVLSGVLVTPDASTLTHLFLGATLCATSVGITARVLKDLGHMNSPEAKLILGAAIIDDVLGLLILTMVTGVASQGELHAMSLTKIVVMASLFLGLILWQGERLARFLVQRLARFELTQARLFLPLLLGFTLSWLASELELAAIVGAFAAGLILKDSFFPSQSGPTKTMHEAIAPLESLFTPLFFVSMGLQVDLSTFLNPSVITLAIVLSALGVIGKLACGWVAGSNVNRLTVGIGMIPRGEVGLIFAGVGKSIGVLDDSLFSAVVAMVIVTTLLTPPALRWSTTRAH